MKRFFCGAGFALLLAILMMAAHADLGRGRSARPGRNLLLLPRLLLPAPHPLLEKWKYAAQPSSAAPRAGLSSSIDGMEVKSDREIAISHHQQWCPHYYYSTVTGEERYYARSTRGIDNLCHFLQSFLSSAGYRPFAASSPWEAWAAVAFHFRYQYDREQFTHDDVAQTPADFLARGRGDCEDHAIFLADWLRGLGYSARVVSGELDGKGHSWVVLFLEGKTYLLEATSKAVPRLPPLAAVQTGYAPRHMYDHASQWENLRFQSARDYAGDHWVRTGEFREYHSSLEEAAYTAAGYRRDNQPEMSLAFLRKQGPLGTDAAAHREMGLALIARKHPKEGLDYLKKAAGYGSGEPLNWLELANALFDLGQYKEAKQGYEKLLMLVPEQRLGIFRLAYVQEHLGNNREARELYTEYVCRWKDYAMAFNNLGVTLQNDGCGKTARSAYRKALELDPSLKLAKDNLKTLSGKRETAGKCPSWEAILGSCERRRDANVLQRARGKI